ncbi:MAG: hypothetical protein FJ137_15260 [Deltaproteobacteria bacterium]|nr:hypothetical protein [Deltaproteobacteria bacterium]
MLPLLVASLLSTAEPTRVLVLDVVADGASATTARVVRDEIAQGLGGDPRLEALSSEDLRRVVSIEAERRAIGCVDDSCFAEIGQALGARYVVHGSLSAVGALRVVRISVLDTETNRSVLRETVDARSDEDLLPRVRDAMTRVRGRLLDGLALAPPAGASSSSSFAPAWSPLQWGGAVVGGVGVAAVAVGGVAMGRAWPTFADPRADLDARNQAQRDGQVGTALFVGGLAVAVAGGVGVLLLGGPS